MKQKINNRLIAISIIAVTITTISITLIFYQFFKDQVKQDLRTQAMLLAETDVSDLAESDLLMGNRQVRITWIDADGTVLYDNDASGSLENHLHRPEVEAAFSKGSGEAERRSDTMNMRTFYYAILLKDGTVLRVATEARSILSMYYSALLFILPIMVVIIGLCILIGNMLTESILKPINEMADDLDQVDGRTEYKELEPFVTRIREQHGDILAAAKSRQDFSANVSHELKTPITAISGYAELISMSSEEESQTHYFAEAIRKNSNRLVSLINDIIRLSELDHKERIPEFSMVDMYEICEERIELLKNNGRERKISVQLHGDHCMVMSNPNLLMELVDNLVQNAIRYNVEGGSVDVTVSGDGKHGTLLVEDTGIGIPKAEQERVFERFYRVDKSRSRETGGTGLGLAIVKHIVEIHDGLLVMDSDVGKGTRIRVEL